MSRPYKILITGANGQLGRCLIDAINKNDCNICAVATDHSTLDITDAYAVESYISNDKFDYVVNCAAYTNVAKAEEDRVNANSINSAAVSNLAASCAKHNAHLIHISTDYVFDGTSSVKNEDTVCFPLSTYGLSKCCGEMIVRSTIDLKYTIIRTSWLYSEYGNNFVKTIINKLDGDQDITVVNDQIGAPTYARDLANFIVKIITSNSNENVGIFHYSNEGNISWFDFAKAICRIYCKNSRRQLSRIKSCETTDFPLTVTRPMVGILSKKKINQVFGVIPPYWYDSLEIAINNIKEGKYV